METSANYQYPFSVYGTGLAVEHDHSSRVSGDVFRVTTSELNNLTDVYDRLSTLADEADRFVAFASGGILMLIHAATRFHERHFGSSIPPNSQVGTLHERFHLLPSVTWLTRAGEDSPEQNQKLVLHDWLRSNAHVNAITFCDTTFSGGAINSIKNAITAYASIPDNPLPSNLRIYGVLDMSRYKQAQVPEVEVVSLRDGSSTLHIEFLPVENLVSEDTTELIGYDRISGTAGMASQWRNAVLVIQDDQGNESSLLGNPIAVTFSDLLLDFKKVMSRANPQEDGSSFSTEEYHRIRNQFRKAGIIR